MTVSTARTDGESSQNRSLHIALWIIQVLLALLFLFAGVTKLVLPIEEMTKQMPMPGAFLRFIGVAEVLGGFGLILPGLTGIRPGLTPLAAVGVAIIMIGATVIGFSVGGVLMALMPCVVLLLVVFIAYARWRVMPLQGRGERVAQPGAL